MVKKNGRTTSKYYLRKRILKKDRVSVENVKNLVKSQGSKFIKYKCNYREKYGMKLAILQKARCNICFDPLLPESNIIDHIIPQRHSKILDEKEIFSMDNLQIICPSCNHIKTYHVDQEIDQMVLDKKKLDDPKLLRENIILRISELLVEKKKSLEDYYQKQSERWKMISFGDCDSDVDHDSLDP